MLKTGTPRSDYVFSLAPTAVREMREGMTVVLFFCQNVRLCKPSRYDGVLGFNFQLNVPQFVLMFLDVIF